MIKKFIPLLFLIISISTFGQKNYNFKPTWNKGDLKTVSISYNEKEIESNELISDTTIYSDYTVKVIKENKESYTLEILYENIALKSVEGFYEKLGEELSNYKNLKLIYKVNKKTAQTELVNWKKAQTFMNESFDQITNLTEKKAPEISPLTKLVFAPIREVFKSKENIEAYMYDQINFLFIPFNKDFKVGEKIEIIESGENPFNPTEEIMTTTIISLESINKENKTGKINKEIILDLSEFKNMMKTMMMKMAESFNASDSSMTAKKQEFDEFEMDMTNSQSIVFNYDTSWPTEIISKIEVIVTEPKKGNKTKKVTSMINVK